MPPLSPAQERSRAARDQVARGRGEPERNTNSPDEPQITPWTADFFFPCAIQPETAMTSVRGPIGNLQTESRTREKLMGIIPTTQANKPLEIFTLLGKDALL